MELPPLQWSNRSSAPRAHPFCVGSRQTTRCSQALSFLHPFFVPISGAVLVDAERPIGGQCNTKRVDTGNSLRWEGAPGCVCLLSVKVVDTTVDRFACRQ